ncbi:hypothetical protein [Nocardia sp. N2S4-5]|uniref:hypothetical protein n=1 Tax=Nocardia sp. N2S4-5 TaxID=3351565 RepID=UPI0037D95715
MPARSFLFAVPVVTLLAAVAGLATGRAVAESDLDRLTPVDIGEYRTDSTEFGGVFFRTPDGRACAIHGDNGPAGCDAVPMDAPEGTNQVRVTSTEVARYVVSAAPIFTSPGGAKVLPEGHRLTLENTTCGVGFQGTVSCEAGAHGFTIAATYGVLH